MDCGAVSGGLLGLVGQSFNLFIANRWRSLIGTVGNFTAVETVKYEIQLSQPSSGSYTVGENDKVKLHEWKGYGYWARPRIRGVDCPNSRK